MGRCRRLILAGVLLLAGCSSEGDGAGQPESDDAAPVPSVTIPAERLTPFCEAMIELADRLETDPPDDTRELILTTYLEIVDEVPPAIEDEFRAVIVDLQQGAATTTPAGTAPTAATSVPDENFDAEGRLPGDSPSERVSDYVLFTCRDSDNNPGPPATEPLDDVVVDDTTG